jgi:hypothetical protein
MALTRSEKILVKQFYKELLDGSMAESGRVLQRIEQRFATKPVWHHGFLNALGGMLNAQETRAKELKDETAYFNLFPITRDRQSVMTTQKMFRAEASNVLQDAFGQGYCQAWSDLLTWWLTHTKTRQDTLNT